MTKEEIIKLAAKGNAQAEQFLAAYVKRAHFLDDMEDADKPVNIAAAEAEWVMTLAANPFFVAHNAMLVPVMLSGLNAWADSNRMHAGPVRDVVKGIWHEVVYVVAWIAGGFAHMQHVSTMAREYDLEAVPVKVKEEAHGAMR